MNIQQRGSDAMRNSLQKIRAQILGMWRFRWLSLALAWIVCAVGWVSVYMMPNVYAANARVYVDTENAINDILGGIAVPSDVMSEVNMVVRDIVGRPNLAEVARQTDIALRADTPSQFEDLLTGLQKEIKVEGNREGVFTISYADKDRDMALAVVDTLLKIFVEKSLGADRTDSAQAQQFLQEQIADYDARLTAAEDRLAQFKRENVNLMPDQKGDYFSRMQVAETRLSVTEEKLDLATERRAELLRQIDGEEPVFGIMSSEPGTAGGGNASSGKIRELELQLAELRLQYTDKHPRIGQILDTIELVKQQEAAQRQLLAESARKNPLQQNPLDMNPVYQNMRIQLSNVEVEIASLRAERGQQQREVAELRRLVDTIPQVEAELNRLNRDYGVVQAQHQRLLQQLESASIGEDVSRSIDEVQFRIIDPPFSDAAPVGPIRPLLLSATFLVSIGIALGIAFVLNLLRPTFVGNRSVTDVLGIPVLASVSLLQNSEEKRAERTNRLAMTATTILLVLSFTGVVMFSEQGSAMLRGLVSSIT